MTPLAWIYFLLGLSSLYWPLVTLFFKRRVLGAQWLIMAALVAMSLSVIIYSTFFNNFLKGEYLLVIIFMVLSMFTPPLILAAVTNLTDSGSEQRTFMPTLHYLVIPAIVVVAMLAVSVIIGGDEMYRLWIKRGAEGYAHHFFAGSWRYNLIVIVHYYLYWLLIVGETTFVGIYSLVRINRFSRQIDEYYTVNRMHRADLVGTYLFVALNCFFVVLSYVMYPFNSPRPLLGVAAGAAMQAVVMFMIGYYAFRTPIGAEVLKENQQRLTVHSRRALQHFGQRLADYVEKEKEYLNPDISVFLLAEYFGVSQDDIIDAVHQRHGSSFADYIDSLRIERAIKLMSNREDLYHTDNTEDMVRLAHQCGYIDLPKFESSFLKIMQIPLRDYR